MAGDLLFGMQTPQLRPWPEMVERWQWFESLGFDSCWLPDHYVPPFWVEGPLFEAWTLLAALATKTASVRLGILVSSNTFRHPPLVAKQAATLDHISGGRLELGLGGGWFVREHQMFGIELPDPPELVARYRDAVRLIDLLLRQEVTTFEGTHYQVRNALFRPSALQRPRPPLTLGAHGPRMLRIVAEYADRWNSTGTLAEMVERNHLLDEQCAAIARDPRQIVRSHLWVAALLPDERPWDSTDAFADFVGRFREAGMTEFLFQPPRDSQFGMLEKIVADVIPILRANAASSNQREC